MTCESGKCTRHAMYHVVVKGVELERNYCLTHLSQLIAGIAQLMDEDEQLHDYVEVEYAMDTIAVDSLNV